MNNKLPPQEPMVILPIGMDCGILDQLSPYRERVPDKTDKRVCHAPGDRCLGCDHYYGKASVCAYADTTEHLKDNDHE